MLNLSRLRYLVAGFVLCAAPIAQAQTAECDAPADAKQIEARLDQARKSRLSGREAEALGIAEAILAQHPRYFRALYTKGLVLADQGHLEESETILQQAVNIQASCTATGQVKPDYTIYNTLGWVQLTAGKLQKSETNLKTALSHANELTPASTARVKSNLGYLYFINGDFEAAQGPLQEAAAGGNTNATKTLQAVAQARKIYQSSKQAAMTPPQ